MGDATYSSTPGESSLLRCQNFKYIRTLLNKLNNELLATAVPSWGWIEMSADISNRKRLVDQLMATRFREGMDHEDLARLEMALVQHKRLPRQWKGLQMVDFMSKRQSAAEPNVLVERLRNYVCSFGTCLATYSTIKDQVWIRLDMAATRAEEDAPLGSDVIFIVHFPHAKYLVTSAFSKKHNGVVFQALGRTFGFREILELEISGKDIDAIGEMLLNHKSQGVYSEYRLQQVDSEPLDRTLKKPRLVEDHIEKAPHDPINKHIVKEDATVEVQTVKETLEKFGPNPLPSLDKIEFKMSTPFVWEDIELPNFGCTVRFEGSSVLAGIKALPGAGLADTLPSFITEIHSTAKTRFEITALDG